MGEICGCCGTPVRPCPSCNGTGERITVAGETIVCGDCCPRYGLGGFLYEPVALPPDVRGALQEAVLVLRGGGRLSGGQVTRIARHFGLKDPAHRDERTEP